MGIEPLDMTSRVKPKATMSFEELMNMADEVQKHNRPILERRADFNQADFACITEVFNTYDTDGSGMINGSEELPPLLEKLGLNINSAERQRELVEAIDTGRAAARKAGELPAGQRGSANMSLCELAQQVRQ